MKLLNEQIKNCDGLNVKAKVGDKIYNKVLNGVWSKVRIKSFLGVWSKVWDAIEDNVKLL